MKKLLILTTVTLLASSMVGCGCFRGLFRGAAYNPCPPLTTYGTPIDSCNQCDSCLTGAAIAPRPEGYSESISGQ